MPTTRDLTKQLRHLADSFDKLPEEKLTKDTITMYYQLIAANMVLDEAFKEEAREQAAAEAKKAPEASGGC